MRTLILLGMLILGIGFLSAQSLCRQVIGAAGGNHPLLAYTVGEAVIQTGTSGSNTLTQGFQQADVNVKTGISKLKMLLVDFSLYPNPASEYITLNLSTHRFLKLRLDIIDLQGRQIISLQDLQVNGNFSKKVNVSTLAEGLYLLRLFSPDQQMIKTIRFERIN